MHFDIAMQELRSRKYKHLKKMIEKNEDELKIEKVSNVSAKQKRRKKITFAL